jgi:hypothetical protein
MSPFFLTSLCPLLLPDMGVRFVTAIGLAGGYFILWQLYLKQRAERSLRELDAQRAKKLPLVGFQEYAILQEIRSPQKRWLNVNNFKREHLEVSGG